MTDLGTPWPRKPAQALRTATIGYLQLDWEGDFLYATQPYYAKRQRQSVLAGPAALVLDLAIFGVVILLVRQSLSSAAWMHAVMKHFDPHILVFVVVLFVASSLISQWTARTLHTDGFSLRRAPGAFRTSRGQTYLLLDEAGLSVEESHYVGRRTYVLWLTVPEAAGRAAGRFGLASFYKADEAERAKGEIADFLGE